jgi:hypothetical protein
VQQWTWLRSEPAIDEFSRVIALSGRKRSRHPWSSAAGIGRKNPDHWPGPGVKLDVVAPEAIVAAAGGGVDEAVVGKDEAGARAYVTASVCQG